MNVLLYQHTDIFIKEYFNKTQELLCLTELPPRMFEHLTRALELNTFLFLGHCSDGGFVKALIHILKMNEVHSTAGSPILFDSDSPLIIL